MQTVASSRFNKSFVILLGAGGGWEGAWDTPRSGGQPCSVVLYPQRAGSSCFLTFPWSCLSLFVSRLDPGGELKGSQGLTSCILDSPASQA